LLRDAGLVDVAADAFMPLALPAGSELEKANVNQVRAGLIAGGYVTAEEIDAHLLAVEAGRLDVTTPPLISAWGRRPQKAISSAELLTARYRRTDSACGSDAAE
jgi:hypothetical protein